MRPSANTVNHRKTISVTGGNTLGLTKPVRATSSHAARTAAIGRILMSKGMPGHQPAQSGKIESIEQIAERREPDHDRQHGVVGARAAVGEDQIAETSLRRYELRTDEHDDRNRDRGTQDRKSTSLNSSHL